MPVSVDNFESVGAFVTVNPDAPICSMRPLQTQCHYCGFTVSDPASLLDKCPKCGGSAWERIPVPGSLLANSRRRRMVQAAMH